MNAAEFANILTNRLRACWGERHRDKELCHGFYIELYEACLGFKDSTLRKAVGSLKDKFDRWPSIKEIRSVCDQVSGKAYQEAAPGIPATPQIEPNYYTLTDMEKECAELGYPKVLAKLVYTGNFARILSNNYRTPLGKRQGWDEAARAMKGRN